MYWCFAVVNNHLAEIFYDRKRSKFVILGHCYVKKGEYNTTREQLQIKQDTKKFHFVRKNNTYKQLPTDKP